MNAALELLDQLGIRYELFKHPPLFTAEDEKKHYPQGFKGTVTKNLFLRDKKGKRHYLVIVPTSKKIDLKKLSSLLNEQGLSFSSPERMQDILGIAPGSVSPLALMNDKNRETNVVIDEEVLEQEPINCHPNDNTATVSIGRQDFQKFLDHVGHPIKYMRL